MRDLQQQLRKLMFEDNFPGMDGLPYAAWHCSGRAGLETLHAAMWHTRDGHLLSSSEHDVNTVLTPKSNTYILDTGVACPPDEVRPLGTKNTSLKAISS
eukprot:7434169-Karenia_brevis.AAC.1